MKITEIKTTPLLVPYLQPYYWARGIEEGACVVLVEIHTDGDVIGYGEVIGTPSPHAIEILLMQAAETFVGRDPFANARLIAEAESALFKMHGTGSVSRFSQQVFAGLEMALWDVMGKATRLPAHALMGGAVRDQISYFGFAQGDRPDDIAADAKRLVGEGFKVIYYKVGRGDARDIETTAKIRAAIGPDRRMRADANEQWEPIHASRMIRRLAVFDVEVVEQPTNCESIAALAQVRATSPIAISADQAVFSLFDAYDVCRQQAADLLVVGIHETGGLARLAKVAHVAEAAGINICIHGLFETGITTCAANQIAATIPNLDDANQYMSRFLAWDIISGPDLTPKEGVLPVIKGPGLGFEIDWKAVESAKALFAKTFDS